MKKPLINEWLEEAKKSPDAKKCGMFLFHNGVVREDAKVKVRYADFRAEPVISMDFTHDEEKVKEAIEQTYKMEGIYHVKVWLNEGRIKVGDDLMYVLVGGDIRPHVIAGLNFLVDKLKNECVFEQENYKTKKSNKGLFFNIK